MKLFTSIRKLISRDEIIVFLLLLFITIISRQIIVYTSPTKAIRAPEAIFDIQHLGNDFNDGVYYPASKLPWGIAVKDNVAIYGQGLTFIVSLLQLMKPMNSFLYYQISLVIILILYLIIYFLILKDTSEKTKIVSILFGMSFLLGIPFSLGIHQGNIDVLLSGILGIVIITALQNINDRSKKYNLVWSLLVVSSIGFIMSVKIYLLLFAIPLILFYPKKLLHLMFLFFVCIIFTLSPYLYGIRTNIFDPIVSAKAYMTYYESIFGLTFYISKNISTTAMATFFTSCIAEKSCMNAPFVRKALTILSMLLLSFVFIAPFVKVYKKLFSALYFIRKNLKQYQLPLILLLLAMGSAAINLIPLASPSYRLCYSFVITLIVYVFVGSNDKIKKFVIYSMIFLCVYGIWVPSIVQPSGFRLFDIRAWNMLLLFHYFFLIKATITMCIDYKSA